MLYKTAVLEDDLLDIAVAKAQGWVLDHIWDQDAGRLTTWRYWKSKNGEVVSTPASKQIQETHYNPSTKWDHGGPIIEREKITVTHVACVWGAFTNQYRAKDKLSYPILIEGQTPLVAAMRLFVASKLGDEVEL